MFTQWNTSKATGKQDLELPPTPRMNLTDLILHERNQMYESMNESSETGKTNFMVIKVRILVMFGRQ